MERAVGRSEAAAKEGAELVAILQDEEEEGDS